MNVLHSPLEASAFDYISFGIFTDNLWTWIAVVAAAVSFWRIKNAGSSPLFSVKSETLSSANHIDRLRDVNDPKPVVETSVSESATQPLPLLTASSASSAPFESILEDDRVTRGKFVMYYEDERESNGNVDDELTAIGEWRYGSGSDGGYGVGCEEWWERVLRKSKGDLGWHRFQDLTAINGNVVRLWDVKNKYSYGGVW